MRKCISNKSFMFQRMKHTVRHVSLQEINNDIKELSGGMINDKCTKESCFYKREFYSEIEILHKKVNKIEQDILKEYNDKSIKYSFKEQWLMAKQEWLNGPNKRDELNSLNDLIKNNPYTKNSL